MSDKWPERGSLRWEIVRGGVYDMFHLDLNDLQPAPDALFADCGWGADHDPHERCRGLIRPAPDALRAAAQAVVDAWEADTIGVRELDPDLVAALHAALGDEP